MASNGLGKGVPYAQPEIDQEPPLRRAEEAEELLKVITDAIIPFIRAADHDALTKAKGHGSAAPGTGPRTVLVEQHAPEKLASLLKLDISAAGAGKSGLAHSVAQLLQYSVNTWDQGFLDKLYASTNAIGLAADLLLAALNTNVHVYAVSPALTLVEKHVTALLASKFGFDSTLAGGISQPGGSAANASALVVARNSLFPDTKDAGIAAYRFTLFTSAHGHYSVEKAAQMFGLGRRAVRCVPVDARGCMRPAALARMLRDSKDAGETPFFVNATAGTTVLGSYDPLDAIADVCRRAGVWMHVDGSWGGGVVFNERLSARRLAGVQRADSVSVCPHKMLAVPVTCSFLIVADMRRLWAAMSLPAGYLFHTPTSTPSFNPATHLFDLADLTPQCGRRADALKLYLALQYHGLDYYAAFLDSAFRAAARLHSRLAAHPDFVMVPYADAEAEADADADAEAADGGDGGNGPEDPPCLQVTFHHAPGRVLAADPDVNSAHTEALVAGLIPRGWMVDYAPGERGKFLRVVVNGGTREATVDGFVRALEEVGRGLTK